MKKMILLFSHRLSEEQREDARLNWGVDTFVSLPDSLQELWQQMPPEQETILPELEPFKAFLKEVVKADDLVLVQGDFGATCHMVGFVRSLGAVPVYATTRREVIEIKTEEGIVQKRSLFQHRRFRKYDG